MKRIFLFLILGLFVLNVSAAEYNKGQGIAYYKAGFPQVAKPLLLNEYVADEANRPLISYYLGYIYFEENQLDSAAYFFNQGVAAQPLNSLNAVGLAMLKMKNDLAGAEEDINQILKNKANKKNEEVAIAIASAYLMNGMKDKAQQFHDVAKGIKSKSASVSVLLGDINLAKNELGPACTSYEVAILYDENCKEAYIKYARAYKNANPALSTKMLKRLKQQEPDFLLVDRELADIYYSQNEFEEAARYYDTYLKSGNSSVQDLTRYAMTLFFSGNFEKSLEIVGIGLQKAPRHPAFNRLAMWINVDIKQSEKALKAADLFFNHTDNPDFNYLDYRYYGQALRDTKQFDLSIKQFETALKMDSSKVELWKDISDMYSDKGDYLNSIAAFDKYLSLINDDKKTPDMMMDYAKLHYSLGNSKSESDVAVKKNALVKADSVFATVAAEEPTGYRGNFWRARTNSALDPETSLGLAKPFYEQTVTLVESKADARFNTVLIECYSYLGYLSLLQNDTSLSLSYWNKITAIDPSNATAKKAIDGIQKALKAKK